MSALIARITAIFTSVLLIIQSWIPFFNPINRNINENINIDVKPDTWAAISSISIKTAMSLPEDASRLYFNQAKYSSPPAA